MLLWLDLLILGIVPGLQPYEDARNATTERALDQTERSESQEGSGEGRQGHSEDETTCS